MINIHQYWMGRDTRYAADCTREIQRNAMNTVDAVNRLLVLAEADGLVRNTVSSGWRPKSINDATRNAATRSNHVVALACDIDDPDRALAQWCISNLDKVAECGIYLEDPRWSPTWLHMQIVPPGSGKRIFIPNMQPPKAPALIGQKPLPSRVII